MIDVEGIIYAGQLRKYMEKGAKPTAAGTLMRVSDSGACERKRAFAGLGIAPSETPDVQTLLAFHMGESIHEFIQEAFLAQSVAGGVEAEAEVKVDLSEVTGVSLSGSADLVVTYQDGHKVVLEFKSASAYGAKLAKSEPKWDHVGQAGLYAKGLNADAVLIVYIAKESSFRAKIRAGDVFTHYYEWDDEVFEAQTLSSVVELELERFRRSEKAIKAKRIPVPIVLQDGNTFGMVEVPAPFGRPAKGKHWECRYCLYNGYCASKGPEEQTI